MKKQEEFETTQGMGIGEAWNSDHHIPTGYTIPLQINTAAAAVSRSLSSASSTGPSQSSLTASSEEVSAGCDTVQEASWASLQRALNAAKTARGHHIDDPEECFIPLPYRNPEQPLTSSLSRDRIQYDPPSYSDWSCNTTSNGPWNMSSQHSEEHQFDFGFGGQDLEHHNTVHDIAQARVESPDEVQGYAISADVWTSTVPTPTINTHTHGHMALHRSDPLPMPRYPSPRKVSSSDELTATLDQFVLAGTPPLRSPVITTQSEQVRKPDQHIDIAGRRKRPRPAALGTAALRSHSYGGPPSMSPTLRFGRQPPNQHSIRHVKSTGQNLNVSYGGIRKPSSVQRSPLNMATFAEAEEFSNLMAERKFSHPSESEQLGAPSTPHSNEDLMRSHLPTLREAGFSEAEQETPHQYFLNGQPSHFNIASPPSTPMKSEFFAPSHMQSMMPPVSAPPQYAVFPDYTPPYSAGPLTTSSWSDAPLTSPEMATFPSAIHMPQRPYVSPLVHEYSSGSSYPSHFVPNQPVEQKHSDMGSPALYAQKQTEFFIQEFPRQKEEHAHAAQQMAQQKPKNYVFANVSPSDF